MISIFAVVACESFGAGSPPDDSGTLDGGITPDAAVADRDASSAVPACDRSKPFGAPRLVEAIASDSIEGGGSLSPDGRLLLYHSNRNTGDERRELFVAERPSPDAPFEAGKPIVVMERMQSMNDPHLLPDGTLLFSVAAASGLLHIESATLTAERTLANRATLPALESSIGETVQPYVTGSRLYVASNRGDGYHIYASERRTDGELGPPARVEELVGSGWDWRPVVTPDDLTIYFSRSPSADMSGLDVYVARRTSPNDKFGPPERVAELSAPGVSDSPTWVSADECTIYFESKRRPNSNGDVWMAERLR